MHITTLQETALELNRVEDDRKKLRGLMQEFCDRVDRGEVRSVKTYAKFRAALADNTTKD